MSIESSVHRLGADAVFTRAFVVDVEKKKEYFLFRDETPCTLGSLTPSGPDLPQNYVHGTFPHNRVLAAGVHSYCHLVKMVSVYNKAPTSPL